MKTASEATPNVLLRQAREDNGWTQEKTAIKIGVDPNMYSRWERGITFPTPFYRDKLSKVYGKTPEELGFFKQRRVKKPPQEEIKEPLQKQERLVISSIPYVDRAKLLVRSIGREEEIKVILKLMRDDRSLLVTLTGSPGVGKTHLALEAVKRLAEDSTYTGICVPLAHLVDNTPILPEIAQVFDVQEGSDAYKGVVAKLMDFQTERVLLLLDNFEHVSGNEENKKLIIDLLGNCQPKLQILVTSRRFSHIYTNEQEFRVNPLPVPVAEQIDKSDDLEKYPSTALFMQRVKLRHPDFTATNAEARAIAEICCDFAGIPLAINLVASRAATHGIDFVRQQTSEQLQQIDNTDTDLLHQKTLEQAFAWSYNLLTENQQIVFLSLAVFEGGTYNTSYYSQVENICQELIDCSLIELERRGDPLRYSMLRPIYEFAKALLETSTDAKVHKALHRNYFLAMAEASEEALRGSGQIEYYRKLIAEHGNLMKALQWSLEEGEHGEVLRFIAGLWWYWRLSGYLVIENLPVLGGGGKSWIDKALRICEIRPGREGIPSNVRAAFAKVLIAKASLLSYEDSAQEIGDLLAKSIALYEELDDKHGIVTAKVILAQKTYPTDPEAAKKLLEECNGLIAKILQDMKARDTNSADPEEAKKLREENAISSLKNIRGLAWVIKHEGYIALFERDFAKARSLFTESINLYRLTIVRDAFSVVELTLLIDMLSRIEKSTLYSSYKFILDDPHYHEVNETELVVYNRESGEWRSLKRLSDLNPVQLQGFIIKEDGIHFLRPEIDLMQAESGK